MSDKIILKIIGNEYHLEREKLSLIEDAIIDIRTAYNLIHKRKIDIIYIGVGGVLRIDRKLSEVILNNKIKVITKYKYKKSIKLSKKGKCIIIKSYKEVDIERDTPNQSNIDKEDITYMVREHIKYAINHIWN